MIPILTGEMIRQRREKLGLTQEIFCREVYISMITLSKWENGEIKAPPFFEFVLRYVEQNIEKIKSAIPKTSRTSRKATISLSAQERFFSQTTKTNTDCVVWLGKQNSFRVNDEESVSPRKAAWLFRYREIPDRDVKLICTTQHCVAWQHLTLGRIAKTGRRPISSELKEEIKRRLDAGESAKSLAREFKGQISLGSISGLRNKK